MLRTSPLRLSIAIAVAIAVLTALVAWGEATIASSGFAAERDVREAMIANQRLLRLQLDEETGLRGFASTGEQLFLEPYTAARTTFPETLATLRAHVAASGVVTPLPDELRRRNAAWLADVARPMLARRGDQRALQRRAKIEVDAFRCDSLQLLSVLNRRAEQIDAEARRNIALIIVFAGIVGAVASGAAAALFLRDIARRRANEARLADIAERDPLTGLLNRTTFAAALEDRIAAARTDGSVFVLAYIDLDGFKPINDRYGHQVGDAVLQSVADRLTATARGRDVVARLGGDEFVVLLAGDADGNVAVRRIAAALGAPHGLGDVTLTVDASIGRAVYPLDGADAEALLHAADLAMYRNKRKRSGREPRAQPDAKR